MQLLLVAQQQVPPSKTSFAIGALKWLLFGVGTLMPLQMLKTSKCALTCRADMWTRLVGFWGREGGRRCLGVNGNGGGFYIMGSRVSCYVFEYFRA